jgi:hypothetical protein
MKCEPTLELLNYNPDHAVVQTGNGAMPNATNYDWLEPIAAPLRFVLTTLLVAALIAPPRCLAEDAGQRVFPTPGAAVRALVAADKASDPKAAMSAVLGPDAAQLLSSGDPVADDNARKKFVSYYQEMHRLAYDSDGRVILILGAHNWPFPIPLVKKDKGWIFDTAAGEQELLFRRIGSNEIYTINVLGNLVDAQMEYAAQMRDQTRVKQYAQKILSDEGKRDGLYWPVTQGQPESPIGPLIATAVDQGYKKGAGPTPFHGYIYRVLTAQGKNAPGGAKSYVIRGKMTRGFAFLAYPVEYRSSGVMTFMVNQDGVIMQKDLGPDTEKIAEEMTVYNPDDTWEQAQPGDQAPVAPGASAADAAAPAQGAGSAGTP